MRKILAVAMGSIVALVGFAGAANASATIDLIWIDVSNVTTRGFPICLLAGERNCPQLGTTLTSAAVTDTITLSVIITAGPAGLAGAGVSVDYGDVLPSLSVTGFQRFTTTKPAMWLNNRLGELGDVPPVVENFSALALLPGILGLGLPAGQTAYLGTVSFHKDQLLNGIFEIAVGAFGPSGTDGVGDLAGQNITSTTTFNSAFVGDPAPTPTATPTAFCSAGGASCQNNAECCSNQCSGPGGNKVCQPGPTSTPTPTPSAAPTSTPTAAPTGSPTPSATPTSSLDFDGDGVPDELDNCSEAANPGQDDTDGDYCGNLCDADYDNSGVVGFPDFTSFGGAFGGGDEEKCHSEPIPGCTVGFPDFTFYAGAFGGPPGPSAISIGTIACP